MDLIEIIGNKPLEGKIKISGSKNASLPIMIASLLTKEKVEIDNIPNLSDVSTLIDLMKSLGADIKLDQSLEFKRKISFTTKEILHSEASYDLVRKMRASFWVLAPLIVRYGEAKVSLPGGCAIGTRPVDLHLFALKKLGAKIKIKNGYILAEAKQGLKGAIINFPFISVGATENALLAACKAKGKTVLKNCAIEPEIKDLIIFLNKLGSKIKFKGRTIIIYENKLKSSNISHEVIFDRIELGTYMIACALLVKKNIMIDKINPKIVENEINVLKTLGVKIVKKKTSVIIKKNRKLKKINITTKPYPGFPTDLQAQLMVLLTQVEGVSKIKENIFENRFMHVPELKRMGAKIEIQNNSAFISGPCSLTGAEVMATDLRASVSLVLAGLIADNRTNINRIYHLDRGYQDLEKKLIKCKARIKRV